MTKNNCFANANPCSGCGACYAVCPVSAISYTLNADGFYEAHVNEATCISCGKCVDVCPKYKQGENQLDKHTFPVYSFVYNDPQALAESSSGAAAWALTQLAIEKGYQVVGVEYDYTSNVARSAWALTLQQTEKFKGSKYLQANTQIYKELLKKPGKFLVFGTPCQLAGLSQVLIQLKRREDFLLVDCFCHGVPSYHVWHKFLKHIRIEHPTAVAFRSKNGGWHGFYMEVKNSQKTYGAGASANPFYQLFFSDLLLNQACYTCCVKSAMYADIRLGDFWGADYDLTDNGVSLVVPLTAKGISWVPYLAEFGALQTANHLRTKIMKNQSSFSHKKIDIQQRQKLLNSFSGHSFEQGWNLYQTDLPIRKKLVFKIKELLPFFLTRYMRYFTHLIKGY